MTNGEFTLMKAIIAAVENSWGIGNEGKIPWYYKEDFAWFKERTKGAVLIMGYNTYAELAEKFKYPQSGKLLAGRPCYIITRRDIPLSTDVCRFPSIEEAVNAAEDFHHNKNIFFIGGTGIFREAINYADTAYISKISHTYTCDTFFPKLDLEANFEAVEMKANANAEGDIDVYFWTYIKK